MFRILDSKSNHWFMHFKSRGGPEHSHDKLVVAIGSRVSVNSIGRGADPGI